jgi:integrase
VQQLRAKLKSCSDQLSLDLEPKIEIHNRAIEPRIKGIAEWRIPESEKASLIKFLEQLELGRVNKGVKISESRQCKYLDVLRPPLEFFGKPVEQLTLQDIETFEKALCSGKLHSHRGTAYAHATRVDMRRAIKVYFRWKLGTQKTDELTDWLDTRDITKTPDFLKEADVEKLYKACKCGDERFLIAVLFDAGARASEFHNIRYEDVHFPQDDKNYVKITFKEEYSKTKGRTVSLFWKYSKEAVLEYLKEREREGIKTKDAVFKTSYVAARTFLHRLGKKILGRSIHYHLFRHSSATYYADKMNRQQLCIRYGWAFSSDMPDIYISRAGVESAELDQKFANAEAASVKDLLAKAEQREKVKNERIEQLEKTIAEIQQRFDEITAALRKNPSEAEILRTQKQIMLPN